MGRKVDERENESGRICQSTASDLSKLRIFCTSPNLKGGWMVGSREKVREGRRSGGAAKDSECSPPQTTDFLSPPPSLLSLSLLRYRSVKEYEDFWDGTGCVFSSDALTLSFAPFRDRKEEKKAPRKLFHAYHSHQIVPSIRWQCDHFANENSTSSWCFYCHKMH